MKEGTIKVWYNNFKTKASKKHLNNTKLKLISNFSSIYIYVFSKCKMFIEVHTRKFSNIYFFNFVFTKIYKRTSSVTNFFIVCENHVFCFWAVDATSVIYLLSAFNRRKHDGKLTCPEKMTENWPAHNIKNATSDTARSLVSFLCEQKWEETWMQLR